MTVGANTVALNIIFEGVFHIKKKKKVASSKQHTQFCLSKKSPRGVLAVHMTGRSDVFFGGQKICHAFFRFIKVCIFWVNLQAIFFVIVRSGKYRYSLEPETFGQL